MAERDEHPPETDPETDSGWPLGIRRGKHLVLVENRLSSELRLLCASILPAPSDEQAGHRAETLRDEADRVVVAGTRLRLILQAIDARAAPDVGREIEIVTTDTSRLSFTGFEDHSSRLVVTEEEVTYQGFLLAGSVIVELRVPLSASRGVVTVVASVNRARADHRATRYATFDIR